MQEGSEGCSRWRCSVTGDAQLYLSSVIVNLCMCTQPAKGGKPGKPAAEPATDGAVPPDSDAQPAATDEAALESLAFDPMAAPASRVDAVGTTTPVEDFDALLARGLADKAFEGLHAVVFKLVDTSIAGRCAPALSSTHICEALQPGFYEQMYRTWPVKGKLCIHISWHARLYDQLEKS